MDPVDVNILGVQGVYILWVLTAVSMFFFVRRITKIIKILNRARPENRFDNFKERIVNFILYVLGQKKLFGERTIGLPHFLFFWGFVFYAGSFWWNLLRGLIPVLPIPYSDEVGIITFALEIMGVLVLLSIIVAVLRRIFFPPQHLQQSFDAVIILSLITILMVTLLLGQGYKGTIEASVWSPIGSIIASGLSVSENTAVDTFKAFWWIHIISVLFFLGYIPYSKHMHLLASPFNVLFRNNSQPADLTIKSNSEDIGSGASKWTEFTWKDLLNSFSCAECGRCDRACPAQNSGAVLAPRVILHKIKEQMYETGFNKNGNGIHEIFEDKISKEELWQCTTCMSCMQQCPVLNEHLPVIISMRRFLINQGEVEQTVQDVLQKITRYGNSFGQSDRNRPKWTAALEPKIKDARKEEVEYLWLTGDYAAFDSRLQSITQKTAYIFQKSGLDFGILYEAEKNSGNDVRRIGEEGLFEVLRDKNTQQIKKSKFKKIITTDPHTYNTLKNEYKLSDNGDDVSIRHYTEVIDELINEKKITFNNKLNIKATYHDPCYLGRYNGVYEPPRKILKSIGVTLVEMPRNRAKSYCCGAGGGRIWMEDKTPVKERPSESRIREAAALKDVSLMVVACPKDIVMFQDAVKTTGNEGKLEIKDISELVFESMK